MARRKRKEEVQEWTPPEFDEVAYMRREIEGARASVATIVWAILGAVVSFLLTAVHPGLAFLAGIAVGFGIYLMLPVLGIRTKGFKRRDWAGHGTIYFFSWLAFWIILLNPPFGDFTDPTIEGVSVSPYRLGYPGPLACVIPQGGSATITSDAVNDSFLLLFRATDNVGLSDLHVRVAPSGAAPFDVTPAPLSGANQCQGRQAEPYLGGTYGAPVTIAAATSYRIDITAVDGVGREAAFGFTVLVVAG